MKNSDYFSEYKRLLIIDDEENMRHMLTAMLKKFGYSVDSAMNGRVALEMVGHEPYDFILCDIKMPEMDGMDFLHAARDVLGETTVIMMSAYGNIETAIGAMKNGAYDYISKPFKADEVYLTLKKAEERERLMRENRFLKERIQKIEQDFCFGNMIAKSGVMRETLKMAEKVARYDTTVLITGESGTGKELVARGIHLVSNRSGKSLITVNCGGIPENLLESEFFGYCKGAFTGADKDKKGLFQEADQGTIFLDEIGELSLPLQVKLLRVLQENEIRPVGSTKTIKVDARVITATAKNLEAEVQAGRFREDLFYRLNVMPITLPPLREREEDIPPLIRHFIDRFNRSLGKNMVSVAPAAMSLLLKHRWPGNVRELENVIERATVLAETDTIASEHLPPGFGKQDEDSFDLTLGRETSLKKAQKFLEKQMITRALEATDGNRTRAAKRLEISHPSLLSKIKAYGIRL
ncbi:MAG: sigma-54-dependent Fis family transcriptional regulator [Deltaproteobacteria bacterium]|nr:sigma-54-dependent Fis family transcriptional regulator [Deltaproteobacteria bacterium]MBW2635563.1 sigma-54-dependent Fis family transcriptional regulator [Deltaproteobacteria bacterium]